MTQPNNISLQIQYTFITDMFNVMYSKQKNKFKIKHCFL